MVCEYLHICGDCQQRNILQLRISVRLLGSRFPPASLIETYALWCIGEVAGVSLALAAHAAGEIEAACGGAGESCSGGVMLVM